MQKDQMQVMNKIYEEGDKSNYFSSFNLAKDFSFLVG